MSCVHHVSLGTNDYPKARAFYDAAMAALGLPLQMETPTAASWGREHPEFWITTPHDAAPATPGNGTHVCFAAASRAAVDAFHAAALAQGGTCDGPPAPRPEYAPQYYAAFIRDLDGNKIEAMFWDASGAKLDVRR